MASLTHVCMWSGNDWKRVTAEQASKLHPGGTVSAHSGLFMCELCGQYVTLTDGDIVVRYFKHSAHEESKNCPERTFGAGYDISYNPQKHDLPIRITGISPSSFRFEIGLIRAPLSILSKDFTVEIRPTGVRDTSYVYIKERLNTDSITYLPIGDRPYEKYTLSFQNGNDRLNAFWPNEINGINPNGTLFEKLSGKKLTYDSDVEVEKRYYLLKRGYYYIGSHSSIHINEVSRKRIGWEMWTLYEVYTSRFDEEAARFYLDFHCRLTDHPVSLQPVWPLFVEGSYTVKHNQSSMYMLVDGNISAIRTFPNVAVQNLNNRMPHSNLYEISCSDRQQLISVGRTQTLQYTYLWKEPLNKSGLSPQIWVNDLSGNDITAGEYDTLPPDKTLRFKSVFDGEIIIASNGHIVDKRKLSANKTVELSELTYGISIKFMVGLDIIWYIGFIKHQDVGNDEDKILKRITNVSGVSIPLPHSLRNIMIRMNNYPRICRWIRRCIISGTINEQSYRRLQDFFHTISTGK